MNLDNAKLEVFMNSFVNKHSKLTSNTLKKLISINTTSPPGNEFRAVNYIKSFLKSKKIKFSVYEKKKNRSNLLAFIGHPKPQKKILIGTHLDTVPAGSMWKTNPFKAVQKGGRIYGRGAEDNKGATACNMILALGLKKLEKELIQEKKQIVIGFFADEESGSEFGINFMLKKKMLKADFAVINDVGMPLNFIDAGEKAAMFLELTFGGTQAHGSEPEKGVNAILLMNEMINELKKFDAEGKPLKRFSKASLNAGSIEAGTVANIVPAQCKMKIDIRFSKNNFKKKILNKLNNIGNKIAKQKKGKFRLKEITYRGSWNFENSEKNYFIKKLTKIIKNELGKKAVLKTLSGGTNAKDLSLHGIRAVGYGLGNARAHTDNEFVEIKTLISYQKIMGKFLLEC